MGEMSQADARDHFPLSPVQFSCPDQHLAVRNFCLHLLRARSIGEWGFQGKSIHPSCHFTSQDFSCALQPIQFGFVMLFWEKEGTLEVTFLYHR